MGETAMWTDDVVARLTDLWNQGKSASEISKALGNGIVPWCAYPFAVAIHRLITGRP